LEEEFAKKTNCLDNHGRLRVKCAPKDLYIVLFLLNSNEIYDYDY